MLDWNRIHELRSEVGDDEFDTILELFLDEVETVLIRLNRRGAARLGKDLHFLKGCAWNLGFRSFGALCDEGEKLVNCGRSTALDIEAVIECYANSKRLLIRTLAEEVPPPGALRTLRAAGERAGAPLPRAAAVRARSETRPAQGRG